MSAPPTATVPETQARELLRVLLRSSDEFEQSFKAVLAEAYMDGHRTAKLARLVWIVTLATLGSLVSFVFFGWLHLAAISAFGLVLCAALYAYLLWRKRNYPRRQASRFIDRLDIASNGQKVTVRVASNAQSEPPRAAEFAIALFTKKREHREACIGDTNEQFQRDLRRYGRDRARMLYWSNAIRSCWPLVRRRLRRISVVSAMIALATIAVGRRS